ncbi:MAG TPA: hemolysin family protein [Candidatus Omnitrophota bacterium]|nr:hemolysin family protein [Candidatus Omnitrophota bacterium]
MWSEILVVVALVLLNGFFAMSELALVSSRPADLRRRAEAGVRGAKIALELLADPSRLLSAVQIGITLVGIIAGAYSGATLGGHVAESLTESVPPLAPWADEIAMTVVVGLITYLSLVVGELVPKRLAMHHSEAIAVRVAPIMRVIANGGGPVVSLLRFSTDALLRLLGQRPSDAKSVTEEEVRALIAEGALAGVIEPVEKEMMDRVMRLADRPAGSVMTPRPDIVWIDAESSTDDIRRKLAESPHSRFLVAKGDIDEVMGVLDTRVILERLLSDGLFEPLAAIREAPAVHEETPVPRLLDLFRESGAPMIVVLDEYGGVEGIVTLTDILEAIAGEMPSADAEGPGAVRRDDGSWLFDGGLAVEEVESLTGLSRMGEEGDFHTLAGFVLARLAHLPSIGESFNWNGWRFEVVDMDGRRIDRILAEPPKMPEETSGSGI